MSLFNEYKSERNVLIEALNLYDKNNYNVIIKGTRINEMKIKNLDSNIKLEKYFDFII